MAIQELTIEGYRSFKHVKWTPGALNLLVGPNGSGKSNLLSFLQLISDVARGQLSRAITEDGILPLLWNHEARTFNWKLRIDPVDDNRDLERDALTLEFEIEQLSSGSDFRVTKDTLGNWHQFDQNKVNSPFWIYSRDKKRGCYYDQPSRGLKPIEELSSEELSFDDFNPYESLLSQIDPRKNVIPSKAKKQLEAWRVYHDVHVERGSLVRMPVVTQYSNSVENDGRNLAAVLHTLYTGNRDFELLIDEGMHAAFGDEYEKLKFLPAAMQKIELGVQWKSSRDAHAGQALSDGTLRFLLLLTVLANPEPPPVLAIDEPDVGLHPSMLPIVAEYAVAASEKCQVILTTHSPEFLDSFTDVNPDVALFQWTDGQSHIFSLAGDEMGPWLDRYRLGQIFTSGELNLIAEPSSEQIEDLDERLKGMSFGSMTPNT